MKKKKILLAIIIFLCISFMFLIFLIVKNSQEHGTKNNNVIIRSTLFNSIKKGNVEIENIEINPIANFVNVNLNIKNLTNEDIEGFLINIELQDKDRKKIKNVIANSDKTIPAKDKISYTGCIQLDNIKEIKNARIVEVEAETISQKKQ